METYDNIYKTICRVCLLRGNNENMVSLIDNNCVGGLSPYGVAVKTFAHITIKKDDSLPKNICAKCLLFLKQAIYFKITCEWSDKQLWNIKNSVSELSNLKERVVDYIMFRQTFPKEPCVYSKCVKKDKKEMNKVQKLELQSPLKEISTKEIDDPFDYSSFDESNDNKNTTSSEDQSEQLLLRLEKIVGSGSSCIGTDYKRVKRKRRIKILKMTSRLQNIKSTEKLLCHLCKKVLANQHTYDCHMQRHNGFRLICEHCGKGFPILTELQAHQVSKHGTGPYLQCQHCPFKAPRRFDLIEHERIHTGERPFACEKCGLTFRRRAIWKKHLIYHSEKGIQCSQCPRKFHQRSEMLAHCNNVHDRIYVYSCSKCGATYAKTATVRRHMTEKHGIPRELQGKVIRINKGSGVHEQ